MAIQLAGYEAQQKANAAQMVEPSGPIRLNFSDLKCHIDLLSTKLSNLHSKLSPMLAEAKQEPTITKPVAGPTFASSTFGAAIVDQVDVVKRLQDHVDYLHSHLEI